MNHLCHRRLRFAGLIAVLLLALGGAVATASDHVIVVDTSSSMRDPVSTNDKRIRLAAVQAELVRYLKELPASSRVHLIAFNSGIVSEREWILKTESELQSALDWVNDLRKIRTGDTYLWSALRVALRTATQFANQGPDQPVSVLVFTDGQDTEPNGPSLEEIMREFPLKLKKSEIQTGLVLLGDLDISCAGQARELGIEVVINREWTRIFPPVIKWTPEPPQVGQEVAFFEATQSPTETCAWSLDGRIISNQKTLTHTFTKEGTYRVTLDVTDASGRSTRSTVVVPLGKTDLSVDFVISASEIEVGQEVKLLSRVTGKPTGYSWRVDGKEVSTEPNHTFRFGHNGDYEVTLEVRAGHAKTFSGTKTIQVREPRVQLAFKCPAQVVAGQPVRFINTSVGPLTSFQWSFGDDQTSTNQHPVHQYSQRGTAVRECFVVLRGKTVTGKEFASRPVPVRILPVAPAEPAPQAAFRIISTPPFMTGTKIQLADASTGTVAIHSWSLGDESTSTTQNPELIPTRPGEKTIRLIVTGPGGTSTNEQTITVVPRFTPPAIVALSVNPPKPRLKKGEAVTLAFHATVTGHYETVKWDFGDGAIGGRLDASHAYTVASNYTVRLTVSNAGNQHATATLQLRVLPPRPWWHHAPLYAAAGLALWVFVIVPFLLKPAMMPHKNVILRSSITYNLRLLAKRGGMNWLWPRRVVTIGTQPANDIRLNAVSGPARTLAVIRRAFASEHYRLVPTETDSVKLLEKYLVPIPAKGGRVLRDGDQICLGDETFSWTIAMSSPKK